MNTSAGLACSLVAWTDAHDADTVRWLNDPAIRASFGITAGVTLQGHRQWRELRTGLVAWAIVAKGQHAGNLLLELNRRHDSAYLQIYIGEPGLQGQGLGRAAMQLALDQAFGALGVHRVWLHTRADNQRAQKLYAGLGFMSEGLERESIKDAGCYVSQERWSLLKAEWKAA